MTDGKLDTLRSDVRAFIGQRSELVGRWAKVREEADKAISELGGTNAGRLYARPATRRKATVPRRKRRQISAKGLAAIRRGVRKRHQRERAEKLAKAKAAAK